MISLIVAMSQNRVIGRDNQLPWRLSADLKRFKALTWGHCLVMGRKTFDSIGRALPGRTTVVVTRNRAFSAEGVRVVHAVEDIWTAAPGMELFIAGGEQLFRETLPRVQRIHLTVIEADYAGDTYFPELEPAGWTRTQVERVTDDPAFPTPYRFEQLDRRGADSQPEK